LAATAEPETQYDYERRLLRENTPVFAEHCLTIVTKSGVRVRLVPKPEQLRFDAALEKQRQAGLPERIVALKARQVGVSTWLQAKLIQRTTQYPDRRALVLAHLRQTAGPVFDIGKRMWENLPDVDDIKPKKFGGLKQKTLEFTNGSIYMADSAREFESGRGLTIHDLHLSEPAFYPDAQRKLTGLLQAVPDEPGTLIAFESTANGQNYFKDVWDDAESGRSDYIAFFSPWYRDPDYRRGFANQAELNDFQDTIGDGSLGEDEPDLIAVMRAEGFEDLEVFERLNWRRWKVRNALAGDLDRFRQEFPSTPLEAFMTTGRHVFNVGDIRRMQARVREQPEPVTGTLEPVGKLKERASRGITVHYPSAVEFVEGPVHDDRRPGWRIFEFPKAKTDDEPGGQYVIGVDASGGDEKEGTTAYHVIDVVDHRTRRQVAEYRSKIDPDELALEVFKGAVFYSKGGHRPWVAIEITGSWGGPAARRLARDFRYSPMYERQRLDTRSEKWDDRLGWHTGFGEKKLLLAELREMLRNGEDGVRSRGLADEFGTYILDDRNRAKPEYGKTADRLMAHGIAVCVAREKPLRPERKRGETRSTIDGIVLSRTGYRGG
jgi:hypothetical protein